MRRWSRLLSLAVKMCYYKTATKSLNWLLKFVALAALRRKIRVYVYKAASRYFKVRWRLQTEVRRLRSRQ